MNKEEKCARAWINKKLKSGVPSLGFNTSIIRINKYFL